MHRNNEKHQNLGRRLARVYPVAPLAGSKGGRPTTETFFGNNPLLSAVAPQPAFGARYVAAVLADSPKLYWQGQEASSHLIDSSGNGNDSTTESTLTYQVGGPFRDQTYGNTKGSGGKATRAPVGSAVNNITMEIWVNFTSGLGSNRTICANHDTLKGWDIFMPDATHFAVVVQGVAIQASCATVLWPGQWYHIVAERDSGTWKYFVNASLDTSNAGTGLPVANTTGTIGLDSNASALVYDWAHFAYYESALSITRADVHFKAAIQQ